MDELIATRVLPSKGETLSDEAAVFLALQSALIGVGNVSPNPLVGCVIRNSERKFLSAGAHLNFGGPHAEASALAGLSPDELRGATLTVTLEPCAHVGKTPSCAQTIANLPIKSVRYLIEDPDPRVQGLGAKIIADRGIDVSQLSRFEAIGERLAEVFLFNKRQNKIFVGVKIASTSDGVYALEDSSRLWITNQRSRQHGHFLRLWYDALLVGSRTVLLDDPSLNVRSTFVSGRTPTRVVLDPLGELSNAAKVFAADTTKTIVFVGNEIKKIYPTSAIVRKLPINVAGDFNWQEILAALSELGILSLLVEGGAQVWRSVFDAKIAQKLHWYCGQQQTFEQSLGLNTKLPQFVLDRKTEPTHLFETDKYYEVDL